MYREACICAGNVVKYDLLIMRGEVKILPNIKSAMKTQVKKFDTAVVAGDADVKLLSMTQGAVDKAAAKGVIHKNAANRKKARLAKRMAKAAQ